jgi:hypothetical protein
MKYFQIIYQKIRFKIVFRILLGVKYFTLSTSDFLYNPCGNKVSEYPEELIYRGIFLTNLKSYYFLLDYIEKK